MRDNGTEYTFRTYFPMTQLGIDSVTLPLNLTIAQRLAKVKQMVAQRLPADGTIYEVSDERYQVDPHAEWFLHEETVKVVDGKAEADVVMDRRVGARPSCSQFLFPEGICKEAFEEHEDNCCVPRQIAAVLKVECADVCRDMDAVQLRVYKDAPTS